MALATIALTGGNRATPPITLADIPVTITLSTTAYATASGGVAVDLAPVLLQIGAGGDTPNPSDIIAFMGVFNPSGAVTSQNSVGAMTLGTPTYTAVAGASTQNSGLGTLATCPVTLRMYGGAASGVAFAEVSDGNFTGTITGYIRVARGGHN